MSKLTELFNSLALKLKQAFGLSGAGKLAGIGVGSGLFKILLLVLALLIGTVILGVFVITRRVESVGRNARRWIVTETGLILLVLASALLLGFAGWTVYDHLQERHISIAAGSRTTESYMLAQALEKVTEHRYPRIRIAILEIEAAPGNAGILEKAVVQLAFAPSELPAGPSARSVAVLAGSPQRILLARSDVDERVVYALTQVLTQFSAELGAAIKDGKAAPQSLAAKVQKPIVKAKSDAPLHPGAAAFYNRGKLPYIFSHTNIRALIIAGLVLIALWTWQLRRRARRHRKIQTIRFSPPAGREPWTFSKILLESVEVPSAPRPVSAIPPEERAKWQIRSSNIISSLKTRWPVRAPRQRTQTH